jgi:DNA-binding transcriptional LysR family regulator
MLRLPRNSQAIITLWRAVKGLPGVVFDPCYRSVTRGPPVCACKSGFLCEAPVMARINLEQLKAFLSIVRLGGVRKAAAALNISQPAVTARIKNLEDALSCDLFDRCSGGMKLTKRGELLLAHAEKFEFLAELVEKEVVDPSGIEGHLRLGVSETIAQCWLPDLVARLHGLYPKLDIELNVDISVNLRSGLLDREIDLAILLGPISDYSVNNIELPGFDLAWYAAATAEPVESASELLSRPVMTYARNTRPYRELKELMFERVGPDVSLFPSSSLSACFRLVEADLGVAVLPRALGQDLVEADRIREFDPGWVPSPLKFTASYLAEPKSNLTENAARTAYDVAVSYWRDRKS